MGEDFSATRRTSAAHLRLIRSHVNPTPGDLSGLLDVLDSGQAQLSGAIALDQLAHKSRREVKMMERLSKEGRLDQTNHQASSLPSSGSPPPLVERDDQQNRNERAQGDGGGSTLTTRTATLESAITATNLSESPVVEAPSLLREIIPLAWGCRLSTGTTDCVGIHVPSRELCIVEVNSIKKKKKNKKTQGVITRCQHLSSVLCLAARATVRAFVLTDMNTLDHLGTWHSTSGDAAPVKVWMFNPLSKLWAMEEG